MVRVERAECLGRNDVGQSLAADLRGRFEPFLLNPRVDFRFPHAQNPRQGIDRETIASNLPDLQIVPSQRASDSIRAAAKYFGGLFDRVHGELLAQSFNFFLGPAPVLIPALQSKLQDKPPARLPGPPGLPLQSTDELIEFVA